MDFNKVLQPFKNFDWRSLKKLTNANAADDFNRFLEKLPQNTSQTLLIIAGISWAAAGAIGLFTTVQLQKLTEIRTELQEAEVLKPKVPQIKDVAVNAAEVTNFVEKTKGTYGGLTITARGPTISITADTTAAFGQFREAIGHVQNGGSGWRVNIEKFCVGRECDRYPLSAQLKINKVSVN